MNKDGSGFQTLRSFADTATDGGYPFGGIYEASDGVLYGTTSEGGPDDYGALYRINRDGTGYQVLRFFSPTNNEGYLPVAPPVEGPGGLLYGSTYYGGVDEGGTLYVVNKDGSSFTFLRQFFFDNMDGTHPNGAMWRGSDGALYGTTLFGGGPIDATVFRIKPFALKAVKSGGSVTVQVEGFAGQRYALGAATGLSGPWSNVATLTNLTGTVSWLDSALTTNRFFRAQILNP
jgi:uncharacterized repeat protein (TIGR03803 family)